MFRNSKTYLAVLLILLIVPTRSYSDPDEHQGEASTACLRLVLGSVTLSAVVFLGVIANWEPRPVVRSLAALPTVADPELRALLYSLEERATSDNIAILAGKLRGDTAYSEEDYRAIMDVFQDTLERTRIVYEKKTREDGRIEFVPLSSVSQYKYYQHYEENQPLARLVIRELGDLVCGDHLPALQRGRARSLLDFALEEQSTQLLRSPGDNMVRAVATIAHSQETKQAAKNVIARIQESSK